MRLSLAAMFLLTASIAQAGDENGPQQGKSTTQQIRVGVNVEARGGACRGLRATVPVPTNWPEQDVRLVDEDVTANVRPLRFRTLDGNVEQVLIEIPFLRAGDEAHVLLTYEVTRRELIPPESTQGLHAPTRRTKDLVPYLGNSPYIETTNRQIREIASDLVKGKQDGWAQVEAIYDWVRENIEYVNGDLKGALAALKDGNGDCEELTSLFIALCRAEDIPARMVWIPGHCYPEFYLEDEQGDGHWFPCQAAGDHQFGGMKEPRPIMQKGDKFQVPEKRGPQRYVAEFLTGAGGTPRVRWVREIVGGQQVDAP